MPSSLPRIPLEKEKDPDWGQRVGVEGLTGARGLGGPLILVPILLWESPPPCKNFQALPTPVLESHLIKFTSLLQILGSVVPGSNREEGLEGSPGVSSPLLLGCHPFFPHNSQPMLHFPCLPYLHSPCLYITELCTMICR